MEKVKRSGAVHGEIHLHEAIIQHIQSFLSCKKAAQTSILCKTWYNAWATRPILYLDQRHFQVRADPGTLITDGFLESSKKVMRRGLDGLRILSPLLEFLRICSKSVV